MVYDRSVAGRELNFEASGALMTASLVMRDRETDSWWSIMTSDAIGGELEGQDLVELPLGEKLRWGAWRERHPESLVLSVDGREHEPRNPYDDYFGSDERTFRGLEVDDDRLGPKESIFSFWLDGRPWAATHEAIAGGRVFEAAGQRVFLHRQPGASMFASTDALLVSAELAERPAEEILAAAAQGTPGVERLPGFDTFWYVWVAVNSDTELLP